MSKAVLVDEAIKFVEDLVNTPAAVGVSGAIRVKCQEFLSEFKAKAKAIEKAAIDAAIAEALKKTPPPVGEVAATGHDGDPLQKPEESRREQAHQQAAQCAAVQILRPSRQACLPRERP